MEGKLTDLVSLILKGAGIGPVLEPGHEPNFFLQRLVAQPQFHELTNPIVRAMNAPDMPSYQRDTIDFACAFSLIVDRSRERRTGDPYLKHLRAVADDIAHLGWNYITVAGALLHDSVENSSGDARKQLPSPTNEALKVLKQIFCDHLANHLKDYVPELPAQDLYEVRAILFHVSKVPGFHNLLYLESINHPDARAIKFSDIAHNTSELYPFSPVEQVRRIYKTWEGIHTGKTYLSRRLEGLPPDYQERLLIGYKRLIDVTLDVSAQIEERLSEVIGPAAASDNFRELEKYRGTPHYLNVTFDRSADDSPFCGTLLRYFGREFKTKEERRRLDEQEVDGAKLHRDIITARDRIQELYAPRSASLQDIRGCVLNGKAMVGLTYENLNRASVEAVVKVNMPW